jgi:hypothetical protein
VLFGLAAAPLATSLFVAFSSLPISGSLDGSSYPALSKYRRNPRAVFTLLEVSRDEKRWHHIELRSVTSANREHDCQAMSIFAFDMAPLINENFVDHSSHVSI